MEDSSHKKSNEEPIALEDVLLALQKSFSRLNRNTAQVGANEARAMLVGIVDFEMSLNLTPAGNSETTWLNSDPNGRVHLKLNGKIDLDIEEAQPEAEKPTGNE